jgi:glyoxylate/hydroxypyruvate reductase A
MAAQAAARAASATRDQSDPVTAVIASPLEPELVERLRAVDRRRLRIVHEAKLIPRPRFASDHGGIPPDLDAAGIERWLGILRSADVLFDLDWYAPADLATNAPHLRWVQASKSGVGEQLRRLGLDRTSITFTNAAGVHAIPLTEWVVLGLLYLIKDVPRLQAEQARRAWHAEVIPRLHGSRVLLIGLGGLGRHIARTLAGLGVEVLGLRRTDAPPPDGVRELVAADALHEALASVDALVLAAPWTDETHHLIGAAELAAMRPGAFVVNLARGQLVDEPALVAALESGHLGGAVLDVFEEEPLPATSPLWGMPNVLISPHTMSVVEAENELVVEVFADNLRRFLDGEPLRNVYDRDRGY